MTETGPAPWAASPEAEVVRLTAELAQVRQSATDVVERLLLANGELAAARDRALRDTADALALARRAIETVDRLQTQKRGERP